LRYLLVLLLAACEVPTAWEACDNDYLVPRMSILAETDATESFFAQLREGDGDIVLDGAVYLTDTLDLAPYVEATTNHISISGSGGFTGRAIISGHLKLSKTRDWEVRLTDVTLHDGSLDFDYVQMSTFTRVRVQESAFHIGAANRLTIRDSYFYKVDASIDSALQFLWDGGALESGTFTVTGYQGPNSYPGPITFNDPHLEYQTLTIDKARGVTLRGGYFFVSEVHVNHSTDIFRDRGEWVLSHYFHNKAPQNVGCN
jgi:hypothetical protein